MVNKPYINSLARKTSEELLKDLMSPKKPTKQEIKELAFDTREGHSVGRVIYQSLQSVDGLQQSEHVKIGTRNSLE